MLGLKHLTFRALTGAWAPDYRMFAVCYVYVPYNWPRSAALFGFEFNTKSDYGLKEFGGFRLTRLDILGMRWEWEPEGTYKEGTSTGVEYIKWLETHPEDVAAELVDRGDTVG